MSTKIKSSNIESGAIDATSLSDGSVSDAKLANTSVTKDKLHSNIISSQTVLAEADVDATNDYLLIYDSSATALKKVAVENVKPDLGAIDQHIIPDTNITYDLGSSTHRFRDLYLSGNTINLGGTKISKDDSGNVEFKDSNDTLKRVVVDEIQIGKGATSMRLKRETTGGRTKIKFEEWDTRSGVSASKLGDDAQPAVDLGMNDTDDLKEGSTNQYFTNARARAAITGTGLINVASNGTISFQGNTDGISEGTSNLYFTNDRAQTQARRAISVTGDATYSNVTGALNITAPVRSVNGETGTVVLNTDHIDEDDNPTNKYFTDARARGAISAGGDLTYTESTGVMSFTQRSEADIKDIVGNMVSGNSETGINVTYQGSDDTLDFAIDTTTIATRQFVTDEIGNVIDSAPGALDTLNELAAALGDDPNFATTVTNNLNGKLDKTGGTLTGALTIGSNSSRHALHIKSNSWSELRFWNDGTEQIRLGSSDGTSSYGGMTVGSFYIYDVSTDNMILELPNNGGQLLRNNGSITVFDDAYHPNADKWTTARTLSLTGDVTGSVSWDGSANASITTVIADNSHRHNSIYGGSGWETLDLNAVADATAAGYLNYRQFSASSSNKPPTGDNANGVITVGQHSGGYTAQLAFSSNGNIYWRDNPAGTKGSWRKVWDDSNDGSGSGLDADTLDGYHASHFATASSALTYTEGTTAPNANNGSFWYNTSNSKTYMKQQGIWKQIAPGVGGITVFDVDGTKVS